METQRKRRILIAPSILSADFSRLGQEVKAVESAGADWLHVDVMDGHFVPNITIGPLVVKGVRASTGLVIESHLMISDPGMYIEPFAKAGSDIITFHIEACKDPKALISRIRSFGIKAGVSIKPKTELTSIDAIVDDVDVVLIMTVEPGFGGQEFMDSCVPKIKRLREYYQGDIAVDGGVNPVTAARVVEAGANVLVAGTAIFSKKDYEKAIDELRGGPKSVSD